MGELDISFLCIFSVNETISITTTRVDDRTVNFHWFKEILADECSTLIGATNYGNSSETNENDVSWEFSGALFFTMTVVTTIG